MTAPSIKGAWTVISGRLGGRISQKVLRRVERLARIGLLGTAAHGGERSPLILALLVGVVLAGMAVEIILDGRSES